MPPPPSSTLFPYTTLFRSIRDVARDAVNQSLRRHQAHQHKLSATCEDRKSTRLNSSHLVISYAVFCLKKKTFLLPLTRHPAKLEQGECGAPTATGYPPLRC